MMAQRLNPPAITANLPCFALGDTLPSEGLEQAASVLKGEEKILFSLEPMLRLAYQARILSSIFPAARFIDTGSRKSRDYALYRNGWQNASVIREVNGDSITVDFNHRWPGAPSILILKCWKSIRRWRSEMDPVG
jgi:FKBP-type peptidyl-prolyl cis-trans isomerase SlpA